MEDCSPNDFLRKIKGDMKLVRERGINKRLAMNIQQKEMSTITHRFKKKGKEMAKNKRKSCSELEALKARLAATESSLQNCEAALRKEEQSNFWGTVAAIGAGVALGVGGVALYSYVKDEWENSGDVVIIGDGTGFDKE